MMVKAVPSLSPSKRPADSEPLPDIRLCRLALEWNGNWYEEINPTTGELVAIGWVETPEKASGPDRQTQVGGEPSCR